jgi:Holliday junction resolvase RusA-like endonuclease
MDARVAPQLTLLPLRTLSFRLPPPVSVNALYRTNLHTGAKYLTEDQKHFRACVIGIVRGEMRRAEQRAKPLLGLIEARVLVSDKLDIDNGLKSLLDALQHAKAYANDRQVKRLLVECVAMPLGHEYCDVTLTEIGA